MRSFRLANRAEVSIEEFRRQYETYLKTEKPGSSCRCMPRLGVSALVTNLSQL